MVRRFSRDTLPPTPWKNGGGLTREIARAPDVPPSAGVSFDWRVSIAHIDADGDFSRFDDIDRVILLLEGGGVRLRTPDGAIDHRLDQPLQPFAFDGDAPLHATLLGGPSIDFNVMTDRRHGRSEVRVLQADAELQTVNRGLLYCPRGQWLIQADTGEAAITLEEHQGLCWIDTPAGWSLQARSTTSRIIWVGWFPRRLRGRKAGAQPPRRNARSDTPTRVAD